MERIARKARVNKAMINYHFGGKAGLYRATLVTLFAAILERIGPLRASTDRADILLRAFVGEFSEIVARRPALPMMLLREVLSGGRHLDRETLPGFVAVFSVVREILERGIREEVFRPVDPLLTHLTLVGSLLFFFVTAPIRDRLITEGYVPFKTPESEAYVRHVQDLMTRALAAQTSRSPFTGGGAR